MILRACVNHRPPGGREELPGMFRGGVVAAITSMCPTADRARLTIMTTLTDAGWAGDLRRPMRAGIAQMC